MFLKLVWLFFLFKEKTRKSSLNSNVDLHHDFLYMSFDMRKVIDDHENHVDGRHRRLGYFFRLFSNIEKQW